MASTPARIAEPIHTPRLRKTRRAPMCRASAARSSPETAALAGAAQVARAWVEPSAMLHPGIDERVGEVHQEIDRDVGGGDEEDRALNHRVVAPENARDQETAEPGNV